MTSTVTAVSLAFLVLLLVGIHSTEIEPVVTPRKRRQWKRERLRFNPRLK